MRGLLERNTDLCNAAIAADQDVNELEKAVDQLGMQVLLKFQVELMMSKFSEDTIIMLFIDFLKQKTLF